MEDYSVQNKNEQTEMEYERFDQSQSLSTESYQNDATNQNQNDTTNQNQNEDIYRSP